MRWRVLCSISQYAFRVFYNLFQTVYNYDGVSYIFGTFYSGR